MINNGEVHIEEPDVFFIVVPTPLKAEGESRSADLSFVERAAEEIAPLLKEGNLVILESTARLAPV